MSCNIIVFKRNKKRTKIYNLPHKNGISSGLYSIIYLAANCFHQLLNSGFSPQQISYHILLDSLKMRITLDIRNKKDQQW